MLRIRPALSAIARALRAIAGVPDYDRYLSHMQRHHPGVVPLSAAQLFATRQRERFDRPGGKCC
jgi:uncharacterized short protein YbdD (DUF466 family)